MHPLADIIKIEISNFSENDKYNRFSFSNKYFCKHKCYNCNRKLKYIKETTYKFDKYGFDIQNFIFCEHFDASLTLT